MVIRMQSNQSVIEILTGIVGGAFEACGYEALLGAVTASDRLDLCQFQCNGAFSAAKLYRKAPIAVAGEVAEKLADKPIFKMVEAVKPGFINLTLTDEYLLELAGAVAADSHLGVAQAEPAQTIIIDYGGPNVAKPLHIGHLRSAIIGESLKRIARAAGYRVIGDVHLGDWGLQMGLVIAELAERHPDWPCFAPDFDPASQSCPALDADGLNEIYPSASQKSKSDDSFKEKARAVTAALQSGHPGYTAVWREMMRVSIADIKGLYAQLNVDFDLWYGESDAEKYVDELVGLLNAKGLLYKSEGALVVDVEESEDKAPVPPVIIKKSDNSNMYATTDLATILQREKDFEPDKLWYVVDKRQGLHFTQVFRCAVKAEMIRPDTAEHLGFGTMNGSDGKPYKTRDGGVMRLSELIDTVISAAGEKIADSGFASEGDKSDIARKIGIAAIKFGDLINHRSKDYIFDADKFLSFEGKTGTYLLYTVTRINSILKKTGHYERFDRPLSIHRIYSDTEREIYLSILMTGEAFDRAVKEKAPNYIAENAYKLASLFSVFYHETQIITEPDPVKKEAWISICLFMRRLLLLHLDVLGIESVESM